MKAHRHGSHCSRDRSHDWVVVRLPRHQEGDPSVGTSRHDAHAVDELIEMVGDEDGGAWVRVKGWSEGLASKLRVQG